MPTLLVLLAALMPADLPAGTRKTYVSQMSYLDNGKVKIGADLRLGGALTYFAPARGENVINGWDFGRQVQMSYYSGPVPYAVGKKRPPPQWLHLGWNPVQTGDDFGNPSRVLEHRNDGKELYVKCQPLQWPLENEPAECTFEVWTRLDGPAARIRCRLTNRRTDKTQYPARTQELPAVYVNAPYHRLLTYTGDRPFTGGPITRIERMPGDKGPWLHWTATECWAAQVDDAGHGVGVWNPGIYRFSGGFVGKPGVGGPSDSPTGYLAPNRTEILDHNGQHSYEYALILGTTEEIRAYVTRHAVRPTPPTYQFRVDRQGWTYINAADAGWPITGELAIHLDRPDPQLIGPPAFWQAADAPTLTLDAALESPQSEAEVYWSTLASPGFSPERRLAFRLVGDGKYRLVTVDLSASPAYRGTITGLRIDPIPGGRDGDHFRVRSIALGNE